MQGVTSFWRRIWPAVPGDVRDDLALLRYAILRAQIPLLYVTTITVIIVAMTAADRNASIWIKFVLPMIIIVTSVGRLIWWTSSASVRPQADHARRMIMQTTVVATGICAMASLWTVASWFMSDPGQRIYYPIFMVVGALAAAFCMSSIRFATSAMLLVGIGPTLVALAIDGNSMDRLAAGIILLGSAFLVRMIQQQHEQLVNLLQLQREMQALAATDPLTGLPNRRALKSDFSSACEAGRAIHFALVDLDNFKPVNDAFGHAAGDKVLITIAENLRASETLVTGHGQTLTAYRLGGDEFALLLIGGSQADLQSLLVRLLASLTHPQLIGTRRIKVGASVGIAEAQDGESLSELIARADAKLYAAKGQRRVGTRASRQSGRAAA